MASTRRRVRNSGRGNGHTATQGVQAPLITYGKTSKLLPLKGAHFLRPSKFDIPSDHEEVGGCAEASSSSQPSSEPNDSNTSPPNARFTREREITEDRHAVVDGQRSRRKRQRIADASDSRRAARAKETSKCARESRQASPPSAQQLYSAQRGAGASAAAHGTHLPTVRAVVTQATGSRVTARAHSHTRKVPKKQKPTVSAARHLPANELVLVAPSSRSDDRDPPSSIYGIQTQDPIDVLSSSAPKRIRPECRLEDEGPGRSTKKSALSSIRQQLRRPKLRLEPIRALNHRAIRSPFSTNDLSVYSHGDGFDESERKIPYRRSLRSFRKRQARLTPSFRALQLSSGPSPQVCFEHSPVPRPTDSSNTNNEGLPLPPVRFDLHDSATAVSSQLRDQLIAAQLSAVSAPELESETSESDADDEDEDSESDENDGKGSEPETDFEGFTSSTMEKFDHWEERGPSLNNEPSPSPSVHCVERSDSTELRSVAEDGGVTYDFRQSLPSGLSRTTFSSARPSRLIEVHEMVDDTPDSSFSDLLESHSLQEISPGNDAVDERQGSTYHIEDRRATSQDNISISAHNVSQGPRVGGNKCHNSIAEAAGSRYFADVAESLAIVDPAKHRIMPRRRSSVFLEPAIQVYDSEAVVPETSSPLVEHLSSTGYHVLGEVSDAMWVSRQARLKPKDLRTLTRTTSKGFGTLSQEYRRRPSLPFQAPIISRGV